eukprot:TRINITY_DN40279_c0_g1_i1.p2 TRINITY_DN40279_c0_g1~~TRINITY_DN40279_c0_g1_i1.p2  ORF type:complete len:190 (+),score=63.26 TRINITY_DN40279_c0_g1_i1:83-652(+)
MGKTMPELPQIEDKSVGSLYSKVDLLKAITEYMNDALPRVGYPEDHFWTNIRIILCIMSCGFGFYAQFGTKKFPKDRDILIICVIGYFVLSGILALLDWFIFGNAAMCVKIGDQSVFVDVSMQTFSADLTIALRCRSSGRTETLDTSAAKYFDTDGFLRQEAIFKDLMTLIQQFEKKEDGKPKETKKDK